VLLLQERDHVAPPARRAREAVDEHDVHGL
jgi:hypothetical protein